MRTLATSPRALGITLDGVDSQPHRLPVLSTTRPPRPWDHRVLIGWEASRASLSTLADRRRCTVVLPRHPQLIDPLIVFTYSCMMVCIGGRRTTRLTHLDSRYRKERLMAGRKECGTVDPSMTSYGKRSDFITVAVTVSAIYHGGVCRHIARGRRAFGRCFYFFGICVLILGLNFPAFGARLPMSARSLTSASARFNFLFMNGKLLAIDRESGLHEHGVTRY